MLVKYSSTRTLRTRTMWFGVRCFSYITEIREKIRTSVPPLKSKFIQPYGNMVVNRSHFYVRASDTRQLNTEKQNNNRFLFYRGKINKFTHTSTHK